MHHHISGRRDGATVCYESHCALEWVPGAHERQHSRVPKFSDCRWDGRVLRKLEWEVLSTSPSDGYLRKCRPQHFSRYRLPQPRFVHFQGLEVQGKVRSAVPGGDV